MFGQTAYLLHDSLVLSRSSFFDNERLEHVSFLERSHLPPVEIEEILLLLLSSLEDKVEVMLSRNQLKRGCQLPVLELSVGNINLSDEFSLDGIDAYLYRSTIEEGRT